MDLANQLTLGSITLPETICTVREAAFAWCSISGVVRIPATVTLIEKNPFAGNAKIEAYEVAQGNTTYRSDETGALYPVDMSSLIAIPGGFTGHFEVPSTVTSIGSSAADTCTRLSSISLPSGRAPRQFRVASYGNGGTWPVRELYFSSLAAR